MKKLADETVYTPVKRMIEESNRKLLIDIGYMNEDGTRNMDVIEGFDIIRNTFGQVVFIEGDEYLHVDIIRDKYRRVIATTVADVTENRLIHWYYIRDERNRIIRAEPYYTELEELMDDEGIELYDSSDTHDGADETSTDDDLTEYEAMSEDEMIEDDEENEFTADEMAEWGDQMAVANSPVAIVGGGSFDGPHYPTLPESYTKGHIIEAVPGENILTWTVPFLIEFIGVAISCNKYDDYDNWSLVCNGRYMVETCYTKDLPEGIHFMTCKMLEPGSKITVTFNNTGEEKKVWLDFQCLCEGDEETDESTDEQVQCFLL